MSFQRRDNHRNTSDRSSSIRTQKSTASNTKPTIPFLSFSTKPDPRLKQDEEDERVSVHMEQSDIKNLLADPRNRGLLRKKSKLNVPEAAGHSRTGNRFVWLTPEDPEPKEGENVQKQRVTFASDLQQKEVHFEDHLRSAIGPALQRQSGSRSSSVNLPRGKEDSVQFPAAATQVPKLPEHAGHTAMPTKFIGVSPQLGECLKSCLKISPAGSKKSLRNSILEQEYSFKSPTDSSDKDPPSTVKIKRKQQAMSDGELPSTTRQNFPQHSRSLSGLTPFKSLVARPDLHRMTAITREQQQRTTVSSVPSILGRPTTSSKAHSLTFGGHSDPSEANDPFSPKSGGEIHCATSAGSSNPVPAPAAIPAFRPLPNHADNPSSKTFYIPIHYRLENIDKDFRYLIGTAPLVLPQKPFGPITFQALAQELNSKAHNLNNWYGLQKEMAKSTRIAPATTTEPGYEQKLELKRVMLRYDFGCGWDEETAGPYDTPISNTQELDWALHLMARRNWRDPLVAYFGLGEPVPLMYHDKGKGKRVERDGDDDRTSKKPKTSKSSSVEVLGSSSRMY